MKAQVATLLFLLLSAEARADVDKKIPLNVQIDASAITVSGATPHGKVVIFSMSREPRQYFTASIRRDGIVSDAAGTGEVTYDIHKAIPHASIWVAVDLDTGRTQIVTPNGFPLRVASFRADPIKHDNNGNVSHIRYGRPYGEFLWVRPGVGAWALDAGNGSSFDAQGQFEGEHDGDWQHDGVVSVVPSSFEPMGDSPAPDDKMKPKDVVIIIDPFAMDVISTEVQP